LTEEFTTFVASELPVPDLHQYLLGSIGPRPIALASTISLEGVPNLSPFSFFNVFSANPPIIVFSPSRRGRTADLKDSYHNVKDIPEVVINVVNYDMVHQTNIASSPYSADTNEFSKAGFTPLESENVRPFRVAESPVQMECKVNQIIELGSGGSAGNLIICEVLKMHVRKNIFNEKGDIDQQKIDLVARMGRHWYCRAQKESMFELPQPTTSCAIGFDQLPLEIKNSNFFTKKELALLANVEQLPDETLVNEYKLIELSDLFVSLEDNPSELEHVLYKHAQRLIVENKIQDAWKTILSFNN